MSVNQSRAEKSESHYRKSGRSGSSGNQRSFSGGGGGKGGGGNAAPTPPQSSTHRSYRKSNNGPGGQPRVNNSDVNISSSAARPGQNGAHVQVQPHPQPPVSGVSDAPVVAAAGAGAAAPGVVGKPTNAPAPRSSRPVPKAPSSQSTPPADTAAPSTPAKADGSKGSGFPLQFGSLSPGFMNGMQIPARTSSAPPNLDEQKRDQARHDSFRAVPTMPIPSAPKQQQQPVKDAGSIKQGNSGESNAIQAAPQVKRDVHSQVSVSPAATVTQKPSAVPLGMSMPMPFQSQVPVPFGHNSQIQSQGGTAPSMQVQMSAGNAGQLQQQVFVPGMQSHQLQTQGMIPQGQGLNFPPQIGHQLPPQMGNMGIGMGSPFAQQQAAKFGGPRKTVKITHPDTHEELTLDKRTATYMDGSLSGTRPHPNLPPQSQPIPSFASAHPLPFFPPSFNPPPMFFAPQTSVPLTSTQMTPGSQPTRYNYTVGQGLPNLSFMNPPLSQLPVLKTGPSLHGVAEPLNVEHHHDAQAAPGSVSSASVQVTVKPVVSSHGEKVGSSSVIVSSPVGKSESPKLLRPSKEASMSHLHKDSETGSESQLLGSVSEPSVAVKHSPTSSASVTVSVQKLSPISASSSPSEESASVVTNTEGRRKETVKRSDSFKDHQKKQARKDTRHSQPQQQEDASDNSKPSSMAMPREVVKGPDNIKSPSEVVASSLASAAHASVESSRGALGSGGDQMPDTCASASTSDVGSDAIRKEDEGLPSEDITGTVEQGKTEQDKGTKIDRESVEVTAPASQPSVVELASNLGEMSVSKESGSLEPESEKNEGPIGHHSSEVDRMDDNLTRPNAISSDSVTQDGITPPLDGLAVRSEKSVDQDLVTMNSGLSQQELPPASLPIPADSPSKQGVKVAEVAQSAPVSTSAPGSKEKPVELNRTKSSTARGKKKRKDILKAADAAGSISDLYMAYNYKGPEEKQETVISSGNMDQSSNFIVKQEPAHVESDVQEDGQSKAEPDDWEDAADISTPKLKPSGKHSHAEEDGNGTSGKKYTRDFLLTLSEHWNELPSNFEIGRDIADALMSVQVDTSHLVDREPYSNSGRVIDRSGGGPRPDRRGSGIVDDDKWSKSPGPFPQGRDPRMDVHGNVTGFRSGPGGNHGVLRNPRGQPTGPYVGGILPMQSLANQGGMHRSNSDADRWQRAKGLIPSPQSPAQMMHKAEKKYEVGKVSDEEQAKQRQLKAILNKLTPQNFEKLFEKVKEVNIDNAVTLTGIISQIFDKALMEPTFCEMYANFCFHLSGDLPDFFEDNEKINFKRLLLNKCQEEFERGEREQAEADRVEEEGEVKCSEEEREEKRVQARRRMLGNIRLIGELYKKKMLTERIMHECIKKLLGQPQNPDEEDIESLCKLMSTIGEMIDHSKAKEHMDRYFDIMFSLSNNMTLSSRVRFMLKDSIDLRRNKWQQRRKVEGPKKIDEVHRDAAQERQAQASRLARGPSMSSSGRRGQPMDFAPRGSSMISSPNSQMGGLRGYAPQNRGYAAQDARFEERHNPYDSRMLSALSQRPIDEPITLGPQGGLARGMSGRGDPIISSVPLVDMSRTPGDSRRMGSGPNGYSSSADWTQHNAREEVSQRYSERHVPSPVYDHLHPQERHAYVGNRDLRSTDRSIDRPMASAVTRVQGSSNSSAAPPAATEKVWPEDRLRDMSIATIREFYSAKDKDEVALCIKDLNSPSFYPSMVSIWVTDSFERKDMERDLLARLLVDLTKPRDSLLNEIHLKKGFESVLATLEDAVNDAPKAAEFLGRILAKVILENVVPLGEIGRLIHEGGEEPGRLLEVGLASEVLGSILEIIRSEKGDSVLNEIRFTSNLRLEDFRPPDPIKSRKLEAFI